MMPCRLVHSAHIAVSVLAMLVVALSSELPAFQESDLYPVDGKTQIFQAGYQAGQQAAKSETDAKLSKAIEAAQQQKKIAEAALEAAKSETDAKCSKAVEAAQQQKKIASAKKAVTVKEVATKKTQEEEKAKKAAEVGKKKAEERKQKEEKAKVAADLKTKKLAEAKKAKQKADKAVAAARSKATKKAAAEAKKLADKKLAVEKVKEVAGKKKAKETKTKSKKAAKAARKKKAKAARKARAAKKTQKKIASAKKATKPGRKRGKLHKGEFSVSPYCRSKRIWTKKGCWTSSRFLSKAKKQICRKLKKVMNSFLTYGLYVKWKEHNAMRNNGKKAGIMSKKSWAGTPNLRRRGNLRAQPRRLENKNSPECFTLPKGHQDVTKGQMAILQSQGAWNSWKVYFSQAVTTDCRNTKAVVKKEWVYPKKNWHCTQWRWFWGRSESNRPNEHACARYYHDKRRFGTCGLSLGGHLTKSRVHFRKTSCKLDGHSPKPCLGKIYNIPHFTKCKWGQNKHKNGCDAGIVIRNNMRFLALTVRGLSIHGAKCKMQTGYHMSMCKGCDCKSLIRFKTFVDPATSNPAGCGTWVLRASNFAEGYFGVRMRQPQMLRQGNKCTKQSAESKVQRANSLNTIAKKYNLDPKDLLKVMDPKKKKAADKKKKQGRRRRRSRRRRRRRRRRRN